MKNKEKTIEDVRDFVRRTAAHYGWKLPQDDDFIETLCEGLLTTYRRYGFFLCPCRDSWGDAAHDGDIKCPCVYSHEDIQEHGQCYCGLFLSEEFAAGGRFPTAIPERRPDELFPY